MESIQEPQHILDWGVGGVFVLILVPFDQGLNGEIKACRVCLRFGKSIAWLSISPSRYIGLCMMFSG